MYYNNAYYARVGGITNSEVNSLEMELLRMISFSLFVHPQQYERYRGSLYSHLPQMTQSVPVPVPVPAEESSMVTGLLKFARRKERRIANSSTALLFSK